MTKPPIGLMPRYIHRSKRIVDIFGAMERYAEAHQPVPPEWVDELRELVGIPYEFSAEEEWEDKT